MGRWMVRLSVSFSVMTFSERVSVNSVLWFFNITRHFKRWRSAVWFMAHALWEVCDSGKTVTFLSAFDNEPNERSVQLGGQRLRTLCPPSRLTSGQSNPNLMPPYSLLFLDAGNRRACEGEILHVCILWFNIILWRQGKGKNIQTMTNREQEIPFIIDITA